jgi:septal ring factor EnvC (AmiA/AmiB activator)
MLSQNTNLDLLRNLIEEVRQNSATQSTLIEEVRRQNANQNRLIEVMQQHSTTQNNRLLAHDSQISELKKKYEEIIQLYQKLQNQIHEHGCSMDFVVAEVCHLRYLVGENEDLKSKLSFYCLD